MLSSVQKVKSGTEMNAITKLNLRLGTYGLMGFLTFVGVTQPVTTIGVSFVIAGMTLYIAIDTMRYYMESYKEFHNNREAVNYALVSNALEIVMFVLMVAIGIYLGNY